MTSLPSAQLPYQVRSINSFATAALLDIGCWALTKALDHQSASHMPSIRKAVFRRRLCVLLWRHPAPCVWPTLYLQASISLS